LELAQTKFKIWNWHKPSSKFGIGTNQVQNLELAQTFTIQVKE
jgi:hypothetical protein